MKSVIIIDAEPLICEFVKNKLVAESINVEIADSKRDAFSKCVSTLPDIIVVNIDKSIKDISDFLEKKISNPNTKNIPIVVVGNSLPKEEVAIIAQYGVKKIFFKPIRFDIFFDFIGKMLGISVSLDNTPCMLELHVNNDILFIELGQGLNRDKIALLKFRISEILDQTNLSAPKVIIMMADLSLYFVDGINLELLLDVVLADERIKAHNVNVLSFDSFTKDLIEGHKEYRGVSVIKNIQDVMNSVAKNEDKGDVADFINDNILAATADIESTTLDMDPNRKKKEEKVPTITKEDLFKKVAVVDDDPKVHLYLTQILRGLAKITSFSNGNAYLSRIAKKEKFDLTFLDVNMPGGYNGIEVLKILQKIRYTEPVIVFTASQDKKILTSALSLGAKSVIVKSKTDHENIKQKFKEAFTSDSSL